MKNDKELLENIKALDLPPELEDQGFDIKLDDIADESTIQANDYVLSTAKFFLDDDKLIDGYSYIKNKIQDSVDDIVRLDIMLKGDMIAQNVLITNIAKDNCKADKAIMALLKTQATILSIQKEIRTSKNELQMYLSNIKFEITERETSNLDDEFEDNSTKPSKGGRDFIERAKLIADNEIESENKETIENDTTENTE